MGVGNIAATGRRKIGHDLQNLAPPALPFIPYKFVT
jgi:hypothetical protein